MKTIKIGERKEEVLTTIEEVLEVIDGRPGYSFEYNLDTDFDSDDEYETSEYKPSDVTDILIFNGDRSAATVFNDLGRELEKAGYLVERDRYTYDFAAKKVEEIITKDNGYIKTEIRPKSGVVLLTELSTGKIYYLAYNRLAADPKKASDKLLKDVRTPEKLKEVLDDLDGDGALLEVFAKKDGYYYELLKDEESYDRVISYGYRGEKFFLTV